MGIYAIGADRKFTTEDIIKAAVGRKDERGEQFALITLDWIPNASRKCAQNQKTHGFEDVLIHRTGSGLQIKYRKPGTAAWKQDHITKEFYTEIADTPYNRAVLASMYRDKLWNIRETYVDRVVRAAADALWEGMSEEEKTFEENRVKAMHRNRFDPDDLNAPPPMRSAKSQEREIEIERAKLFKERREIEKLAQKLRDDQKRFEEKLEMAEKNGIKVSQYSESYLKDLPIKDLRRLCHDHGITQELSDKKAMLVEKIIAWQHGHKFESGADKAYELNKSEPQEDEGELTE